MIDAFTIAGGLCGKGAYLAAGPGTGGVVTSDMVDEAEAGRSFEQAVRQDERRKAEQEIADWLREQLYQHQHGVIAEAVRRGRYRPGPEGRRA